jgi:hypothetical protein
MISETTGAIMRKCTRIQNHTGKARGLPDLNLDPAYVQSLVA